MTHAVTMQFYGGPHDGLEVRTIPCTRFTFDQVRLSTGEVTQDIYALEVTDAGRFRFRYLSSQHLKVGR